MDVYSVYDNYELDMEHLGDCFSLKDAKAIGKEREKDTDGECDIVIIDYTGKRMSVSLLNWGE